MLCRPTRLLDMKLAFAYGAWSVGQRPFDFERVFEDPRGLTGSEVSFLSMAREMARRGHLVTIFTRYKSNSPSTWEGCTLLDIDVLYETSTSTFDCVLSWNEPDVMRRVDPKLLRIVN